MINYREILRQNSKTNAEIEVTLFSSKHQSLMHLKKLPDFNTFERVLEKWCKQEVPWTEYLEVCKLNRSALYPFISLIYLPFRAKSPSIYLPFCDLHAVISS